jgi:hypothetical protein
MAMTLADVIEHADNLTSLLVIKRSQLAHMKIDAFARQRHELAITALEGRVRELRRYADELRSDEPTLELVCVLPCRPPLVNVTDEPQPVGDLTAAPGDLCA